MFWITTSCVVLLMLTGTPIVLKRLKRKDSEMLLKRLERHSKVSLDGLFDERFPEKVFERPAETNQVLKTKKEKLSTNERIFVQYLIYTGGQNINQLRKAAGGSLSLVFEAISSLVEKGIVEQDSIGVYRVVADIDEIKEDVA